MHVDIRERLHSRSIAVHNHAMKETANVEKESEQASQEQGTLRHSARCFVRFRAASIHRTLLCFQLLTLALWIRRGGTTLPTRK